MFLNYLIVFFVILYKSLENKKKENQNRNIYLFKNINIFEFENLIFNLF